MLQEQWVKRAQSIAIPSRAFIDGRYVDALSGRTFDDINPATGKLNGKVAECDAADVDAAVRAARRAFRKRDWAGMDPRARKRVLLKAADLMEAKSEELALLETLDIGKPIRMALNDVASSIATFRWYAEAIDKVYGEIGPTGDNDMSLVVREAIGVVAAVVPWNFPLLMASWKIAPALAAGNSVVLKPAEQSPLTAIRIAEFFAEAGVPEGVFNVVPGYGETAGKAIGLHDDINMVAFTGSTQVGKLFLQYSGQSNMKRVSLECGGKSPNIVMADAPNLEQMADATAEAIFYNQGEVCTAGSRLYVHRSMRDKVVEMISERARAWAPGDPLDPATSFGSMVDEGHMKRVLDYIDIGKSDATLAHGGAQVRQETGGFYVEPTIFTDVKQDCRICQEEIFGPVLSVIDFDDPEEAIAMANDSQYGLAAAVWSKDISTALKTARRLESGIVWVNNWDGCNITVPFGGYKQSGIGRDRSLHALEKYTEMKLIWVRL